MYKDGSLEIIQAAESDTGFYKCVARFRSLTFESRQAYVKVDDRKNPNSVLSSLSSSSQSIVKAEVPSRPAPRFYLAPEDRNAQLDDEVIFDCLAHNDASIQVVSSSSSSSSNAIGSDPNATDLQLFRYKWLKDGIALDLR